MIISNYRLTNRDKGNTLTSLLISMVVIGMATIGYSSGKSTLEDSKIKKLVLEAKSLESAISAFKTKHGYLPGDFPKATELWGATVTSNGDASGDLYNSYFRSSDDRQYLEGVLLPQHLFLAGFIEQEFNGKWGRSDEYEPNVNTPDSSYSKDAFFTFGNYKSSRFPIFQREAAPTMTLGAAKTYEYAGWDSAVTVADAMKVENKIDDGKPSTGNLITMRGDNFESYRTKCISKAHWDLPGSAEFLVDDTTESCILVFYSIQ
jgi:hypothetical protein